MCQEIIDLQSKHPEICKAHRSMLGNYPAPMVCFEWRGKAGLVSFCEWAIPHYKPYAKLKRLDNTAAYSPSNCNWVVPKCYSRITLTPTQRNADAVLAAKYPTLAQANDALNALMNQSIIEGINNDRAIDALQEYVSYLEEKESIK